MAFNSRLLFFAAVLGFIIEAPGAVQAEGLSRIAAERLFLESVKPLLVEKCQACHGADANKIKGDLDLSDRAAWFRAGESGVPVVTPGDPEKSLLFQAINWRDGLEMPPKENDRLTLEQIEWIRQWIKAGAPWPKDSPPADVWSSRDGAKGVPVPTSGGLSADWTARRYDPEALWAFQPLATPAIPTEVRVDARSTRALTPASRRVDPGGLRALAQTGRKASRETDSRTSPADGGGQPRRSLSPIDAFVNLRLRQENLAPANRAERRTLIRRATFDLTGLPPAPEEVEAFLADDADGAFARVVDRLLAAPQYGEQMARRWLDVVRYADTDGYANDYERSNAWRYRDYVARAFNQDKPFDRFLREQLAGDELDADDPECLIAVGFLRMGPWEHTIMSVVAETRQLLLDDIVNTVGNTFLGLEMSCCRCHDHKFDPLPTRDYYRLQAVFATLQPTDRKVAFLPQENSQGCEAGYNRHKQVVEQKELRDSPVSSYTRWHNRAVKRYEAIAYSVYNGSSRIYDSNTVYQFPPEDEGTPPLCKGGQGGSAHQSDRVNDDDHTSSADRRDQPGGSLASIPSANEQSTSHVQQPVQQVSILLGGSLASPGEAVGPGALSAIAGLAGATEPAAATSIPENTSGRRQALANWMTGPHNPLTPRVFVNRVWQQHFGEQGLVRTPNQFGKMGSRPTHPELLDWLAGWFVEQGWSTKQLHRLIMLSDAYCRDSSHPDLPAVREADPENKLLAVYPARRLAADELRDAMLFVSGELNSAVGGPPAFPEINWDAAMQPRRTMVKDAPPYQPSATPAERNRRTLYAFRIRGLRDPFLEVFNQPDGASSCARRDQTTVTPQVFALFNSEFAHRRALAMAARLCAASSDQDEQLRQAFRLAFGRAPTDGQLQAGRRHLQEMTANHRLHAPPATEGALRELVRGASKHEPEYADRYQPDLQLADADATTRGLAELCLVLLNSSEFLYVE